AMPVDDDKLSSFYAAASGAGDEAAPWASGAEAAADALLVIEYDHALKLHFCDLLEEIADHLPGRVDGGAADGAWHVLQTGFRPHVDLEEQVLFPLLRRRLPDDPVLAHACAQLEKEHGRDIDFALEIAEELQPLAMASGPENPEMLGYML